MKKYRFGYALDSWQIWTAILVAVLLAVLWVLAAHAGDFPTTTFYDKAGRKIGSATTYSGGATKFYDERGNLVGSTHGGKPRDRR